MGKAVGGGVRVTRVKEVWGISPATLEAFNNRIMAAPGAAVPAGMGSIGKKAKAF